MHAANRPARAILALLLCLAIVPVGAESRGRAEGGEPEAVEPRRGGALDSDCRHVGDEGYGYQFIVACPGRAPSPNGAFAVVQETRDSGVVVVSDQAGRELDTLHGLMDAMPFVVIWSPRGDWFLANHYQGSSYERLRVFQVVNRTVVERSAVYAEAVRTAVARYPCLGRSASVYASGWRWNRDGRRIAMTVYARPDACLVQRGEGNWVPDGEWEVLWMIGHVDTGRIDPSSVRVRRNGVGPMPTDGPYARL